MNYVYKYLEKKGYIVAKDYYTYINDWLNIWKGKSEWLKVQTVDNQDYPMYSLGMAKRSCEDFSKIITSEPFQIKANANDEILQKDLKNAKVLKKLRRNLENLACTGTLGTVARIVKAEYNESNKTIKKGRNTKIKTIDLKANQIIPLTFEDDEIINCAFVSEITKKINNKQTNLYYLEVHELKEKGYQITNKYFEKDTGEEVKIEGIVETYNTHSQTPLFTIIKTPKSNPIDNNNGLGISLFGDSLDQLKILDLTYNNLGMDFKLGQKILIINRKLTQVQTEEYKDENGEIKTRQKVIYPTDIKKQLFTDVSNGIMANSDEKPYVYEYNPDLRVGDNKEGVQFALDTLSFKLGFGTHYYSFDKNSVKTATEALISRQDFVVNGNDARDSVNEYLKGVCKSLLLCEKILGTNINSDVEIDIAEVDGFLEDENTIRERLKEDQIDGYITKTRYLMKVYNMTEEEAKKELEAIKKENEVEPIKPNIDDEGE